MNVSHKHKIIWFAPEKTATKELSKFLKNFDFEFKKDLKIPCSFYNDQPFYCSNEIKFDKNLKNYKILLSTRNPYDRIVSLFINYAFSGKIAITKQNKNSFKKYVWRFLHTYCKLDNKNIDVIEGFIKKWDLSTFKPDYFVRTESIIEDLSNIDFIKEDDLWKKGIYEEYFKKNTVKNYHFSDFYDIYSAKMVFDFYKNHFLYFEYDPFSFTNEKLSREQKISFIHDNFY